MMEEIVETLNNVFETYQWQIKRLENRTKEGSLWVETIVQAQEAYNGLSKLLAELTRGLEEFQEGLPSDPEGNPVLPVYGEPGYRFRPVNIDQFYDRIGAALC